MAKSFEVQKYLTEVKLAAIIKELAPEGFAEQFCLPGRRYRWDFKYVSPSGPVLVEYDGDEHYRSTLVIKADQEKERMAAASGHRMVRFPYWLQLDAETLRFFFGFDAQIKQDFPHGFITTKLFPASFCPLGLKRFIAELSGLPETLQQKVRTSLKERVAEHGVEYVVPVDLMGWFERQG